MSSDSPSQAANGEIGQSTYVEDEEVEDLCDTQRKTYSNLKVKYNALGSLILSQKRNCFNQKSKTKKNLTFHQHEEGLS